MKLDLFNPWRDLVTWSGITLQYQTSKRGKDFVTYIREKETKAPITFGQSRNSKEESVQRASDALKAINIDGVKQAMETGQMIRPSESNIHNTNPNQKDIDWRDGANHRYRAQREIVDKGRGP